MILINLWRNMWRVRQGMKRATDICVSDWWWYVCSTSGRRVNQWLWLWLYFLSFDVLASIEVAKCYDREFFFHRTVKSISLRKIPFLWKYKANKNRKQEGANKNSRRRRSEGKRSEEKFEGNMQTKLAKWSFFWGKWLKTCVATEDEWIEEKKWGKYKKLYENHSYRIIWFVEVATIVSKTNFLFFFSPSSTVFSQEKYSGNKEYFQVKNSTNNF